MANPGFHTSTGPSGGTTPQNIAISIQASPGDQMLMVINTASSATFSCTGWTPFLDHSDAAGRRLVVLTRVAQSGDAGTTQSVTSSPTGASTTGVAICCYSNVTSIDVSATSDDGGTTSVPVAPAITTTGANELIIPIWSMDASGDSAPSPYTARLSSFPYVADTLQVAAGSTGTITMSGTTSVHWAAATIALSNAAAGGAAYLPQSTARNMWPVMRRAVW